MTGAELIVAALAAGASAGLTDTVSSAVKDAYTDLRAALRQRLTNHGRPVEAATAAEIAASGADRDEEVLSAARRLLAAVDQPRIDLREAKGVRVGDHDTRHNAS